MNESQGTAHSRSYLEQVVGERARHETAEEVRTTCSFARAERLLGRDQLRRRREPPSEAASRAGRAKTSPSARNHASVADPPEGQSLTTPP